MPRSQAARRRATWLSAAMSAVFAAVVFAPGAGASASFAVVNGTVDGTALHVIGSTNAFPNFATGAIDNRYPLAHAHVDGAPFSEGTGSPADTGPLGATVAASAQKPQPQYADARYPPKSNTQELGKVPGPHALATAAEDRATALATFAGTPPEVASGTSPTTRAASYRSLNDALLAWRSSFMSPAMAARYPFAAADPNEPDSVDGLTASSRAVLDPARGLVLSTDARLKRAVLAGGAIRLVGLHAILEIVNNGTPKQTLRLDVADAMIGGVPVRLDRDGVVVNTSRIPDLVARMQQASDALNQALARAGFRVSELAPEIKKSPSEESVVAAAALVRWEQPPTQQGVPQQAVELRLGEAFGDSLAMPEQPLGLQPLTGNALAPRVGGITGSPAPAVQGTPQPQGVPLAAHAKPRWLLLSYLAWQALMIGTVASLWWWRAEGAPS